MISNPLFEKFDEYVADLMRDLQVPGAAVAIVEKDRVVLSSGYGVRKLGGTELVDEETMFAIGSLTKALTTTLVARYIDEGKMSWDTRVTDYLKDFKLFDSATTEQLTLRDVATHRTGLPSTSPLIRYELPFSGKEVIARLQHLKPAYPFRSRYCYNDVAFATFSECIEVVADMDWAEVMQDKLFAPLKMESSHMSTSRLKTAANLASAHGLVDGALQPVVFREKENTTAAAAVNSNLLDITQFLLLHVNGGMYKGKQLIRDTTIKELYSPQIPIRSRSGLLSTVRNFFQPSDTSASEAWSGLGWDLEDFHGHRLIRRTGAVPGMVAQLILIPENDVGIAILSNSDVCGKKFLYYLGSRIVEACLKLPSETQSTMKASKEEKKEDIKPTVTAKPSADLIPTKYIGTYCDKVVGDVDVEIDQGRLTVSYGNLIGDLEPGDGAEFQITWRDPYMRQYQMKAIFSESEQDKFQRLEIKGAGIFDRISDQITD